MAVVSADSTQIAAVEEVTPGVTPASPVFEVWRTTGESLTFAPNTVESGEFASGGRCVRPSNVAGVSVSGDINFELAKFQALDEAIEGVLAAAWGECPLTGAPGGAIESGRITVGRSLKTYTIEKRFVSPGYVPGATPMTLGDSGPGATVTLTFAGDNAGSAVAQVEMAVDGGNPVLFRIQLPAGTTAIAAGGLAATAIDAHSDFTATDNADGSVTVGTTGTTISSVSTAIGPDQYQYQRYVGASYNVLNLATAPNEIVTGSVSVVSGIPVLDHLPLEGATYNPAAQNAVFTAPEVMAITVGAALGIGTNCFTSIEINLDSQNRGIACIGFQGEKEVVLGQLLATVSGEVYFADQAILQSLLDNEVLGDGEITFSNADGEVYRLDLFGLKATSAELAAGGAGEDLVIPLEMQPGGTKVCDDGAGNDWSACVIISDSDTAPTLP